MRCNTIIDFQANEAKKQKAADQEAETKAHENDWAKEGKGRNKPGSKWT